MKGANRMPVRRRKGGSFYHYEFWIEGVRYYGCFNGKKGKPLEAV
jgi:hypothetical protein